MKLVFLCFLLLFLKNFKVLVNEVIWINARKRFYENFELIVNFRYISKLQNGESRAWIELDQIFGIKWDRAGWEELSQTITS